MTIAVSTGCRELFIEASSVRERRDSK